MSSRLMSPGDCDQALLFNGDIAGIGVRVSFYIQTFLLVIQALGDREAESALWTLVATSFGLTVASLAQVGAGQLTLLQGILVSQLDWLAWLATYLSLASYSRSRGRDNIVKVVAVAQGYFTICLTIAMWARADKLPLSDCPDAQPKFAFFGAPLNALSAGRGVALGFSSFLLVTFTYLNIIEGRRWWARRNRRRPGRSSRRQQPRARTSFRWVNTQKGALNIGIVITQFLVLCYFVVTTELIIVESHARVSDSTTWGFGQVLAMTLLIPLINDLGREAWKWMFGDEEEDNKEGDNAIRPATVDQSRGHNGSLELPTSALSVPQAASVHRRDNVYYNRAPSATNM